MKEYLYIIIDHINGQILDLNVAYKCNEQKVLEQGYILYKVNLKLETSREIEREYKNKKTSH